LGGCRTPRRREAGEGEPHLLKLFKAALGF
jgi:hypothetical protein